jgi:F0F1-type ATP synthase delta subunit
MKVSRTVLAKTLAAKLGDPNLAQETAAYLITERRTHELDSLLRDIEQYQADNKDIIEVRAVSAHPLTPAVESDIKATIQALYPDAKQIIITAIVDPDVMGGVRLELANQQLDLTVRNKLNKFKQLTAVGE